MNLKIKEAQVFYDAKGNKTHVLLPYKKYQLFLEMLEDMEDIKSIEEVRSEPDIPFEEVKKKFLKRKR